MSHKFDKTLADVFHEPISANIHWRDVEALLNHLDAEVSSHGSRLQVIINGHQGHLHRPHHGATLTKQDVRTLREFLRSTGVTP